MSSDIWEIFCLEIWNVMAFALIITFAVVSKKPKVCNDPICYKLNSWMINYMKKRLQFEDASHELIEVKRQLEEEQYG